jgi:hypothetical protein
MPAIGMENLNHPATRPGQLTAEDLREHWPPAAPRIPRDRHVSLLGLAGLLLGTASALFAWYLIALAIRALAA